MTKNSTTPTDLSDADLNDAQGGMLLPAVQSVREAARSTIASLEDQDKLGNFEIQDLMSRFNKAEALASSVQKKKDDTANAIIGKI